MSGAQMTERVLAALDDPHLTLLGHPTGRLLLTREPYAIDLDAVIEKAGARGVAIELNADPHRSRSRLALLPRRQAQRRDDRDRSRRPFDPESRQHADRVGSPERDGSKRRRAQHANGEVFWRTRRSGGLDSRASDERAAPARGSCTTGRGVLKRGPALVAHAAEVYDRLAKEYPDAHCELDYRTPL